MNLPAPAENAGANTTALIPEADVKPAATDQLANAQTDTLPQAPTPAANLTTAGTKRKRSDSPVDTDTDMLDAVSVDHAQAGTKRSVSPVVADTDMLDAGSADNAATETLPLHAKQHQQHETPQHIDNEQAWDANQAALEPHTAPTLDATHMLAPQQLDLGAEYMPDESTAQAAAPMDATQQASEQLSRPGTDAQTLGQGRAHGQQLGTQTSWGDNLGRVVQWCQSHIVQEHLLTELQVCRHRHYLAV